MADAPDTRADGSADPGQPNGPHPDRPRPIFPERPHTAAAPAPPNGPHPDRPRPIFPERPHTAAAPAQPETAPQERPAAAVAREHGTVPAEPGKPAGRQPAGRQPAGRQKAAVSAIWRMFAFVVVALRYPILLAWVVAAVAATFFLPGITPSANIGGLVPSNSPALQAEYDATRLFGAPLTAQVAVVQRNPSGFSRPAQVAIARRIIALDRQGAPAVPGLGGAVPIANTNGIFPGSRERSTTIITFLYFRRGTSVYAQTDAGQAFASRYLSAPADHLVGITGPAPAQAAQGTIIQRFLPWVELATVVAIVLIVGLHFRSVGAPLATLLCAGIAYLIAIHVIGWAASRFGVMVPPDLEPVLVVLLLGVTTDYSVFFLSGMRTQLAAGAARVPAARRTTAEFSPIIVAAGLVVALGAASLAVARLGPLRTFGPTLAVTVLIAMVVSVTLAPALIAVFGGVLFHRVPVRRRRAVTSPQSAVAGNGGPPSPRKRVSAPVRSWSTWAVRLITARPVALVVIVACIAGLLMAAAGLRDLRLGFGLIRALPATSGPARAEAAASKGFVPGVLAPTEVIVLGQGVTRQRPALARLQHALAKRADVAGVIGPADFRPAQPSANAMLARSGNAARYGVITRSDPLGPAAIDQVRALRQDLPAMIRTAGLTGARYEVGGETAVVSEAIDATQAGMRRVAVVIALVILVLLAIFLRSLIAPFYLLAASVLALLSALGLTVWIFQIVLGYSGLVYYVPFAVAVLLVSLGSDYNLFVVGRIWEEARRRPLRGAVVTAVPRASSAITTAGLALAAGFAMLAIVPLDQFRELAVAMALGIVIDTFIVRSLLVPSLVVLSGRAGKKSPAAAGPQRPVPHQAGSADRG